MTELDRALLHLRTFAPPDFDRLMDRSPQGMHPARRHRRFTGALLFLGMALLALGLTLVLITDNPYPKATAGGESTALRELRLDGDVLICDEPHDGLLRTVAGEFLFAQARFVAEVEVGAEGPKVAITLLEGHGSFVGVPPTVLAIGVTQRFASSIHPFTLHPDELLGDEAFALFPATIPDGIDAEGTGFSDTDGHPRLLVHPEEAEAHRELHLQATVVTSPLRPLPGAKIRVTWSDESSGTRCATITTSDDAGRSMILLPEDAVDLEVEGVATSDTPYGGTRRIVRGGLGQTADTPVHVRFLPRRSLSGTVLGPDGMPAGGVTVLWKQTHQPTQQDTALGSPGHLAPGTEAVVTDEQGRFAIHALHQQVVIRAETEDLVSEGFLVWSNQLQAITLQLKPAARITGRLFRPDRTPAVDGWVKVRTPLRQVPPVSAPSSYEVRIASTNADGTFTIAGIAPPETKNPRVGLLAGCPQTPISRGLVRVIPGGTVDHLVQLEPPARIRGRLVDADGRPVSGYEIAATIPNTRPLQVLATAYTDPGGAFLLDNLPARTLTLELRRPDQTLVERHHGTLASHGTLPLQLRLAPRGELHGTVVDAIGRPQPRRQVTVTMLKPTEPRVAPFARAVLTDQSGAFAISDLPEGEYTLVIPGLVRVDRHTSAGPVQVVLPAERGDRPH